MQLKIPQPPGMETTIVPGSHGHSFHVRANKRFRIVDLHGEQVIDLMAWPAITKPAITTATTTNSNPGNRTNPTFIANLQERLSMSHTRFQHLGQTPTAGDCLYTNRARPLLRITQDTVKVHDMTFMACYPELYERRGIKGHRSCATNIAEAMAAHGVGSHLELPDPFNVFQNTPNYSIKGSLGVSRPGDHIEFEALDDVLVAVSCCPYDLDGFNGGKSTDVAVLTPKE